MEDPDVLSLRLLLAIDATGSMGAAAQAHGLSQPAVSARVRDLEAALGLGLVERGTRGSRLSPDGIVVAGWAQVVVEAVGALRAGVATLQGESEHRLRVSSSLTVAEFLLPQWLVRLAVERPETTVSLEAANSAHVATEVLAGRADLGFVEGPGTPSGLDGRVVAADRLVLIVPPAHPWARRRRDVTADELARTRLVSREPTSGTRATTEAELSALAPLATPLLELSTTRAILTAVAAGAGPAVVSELAVVDDVAAGRIRVVGVAGVGFDRTLRAVWPRGQRPTGPARDLLAITRRHSTAWSSAAPDRSVVGDDRVAAPDFPRTMPRARTPSRRTGR